MEGSRHNRLVLEILPLVLQLPLVVSTLPFVTALLLVALTHRLLKQLIQLLHRLPHPTLGILIPFLLLLQRPRRVQITVPLNLGQPLLLILLLDTLVKQLFLFLLCIFAHLFVD